MKEFFGQYDLLGKPVLVEPKGRITVLNDKFTKHIVNEVHDGVDLVFDGLVGINSLICRLIKLRDDMIAIEAATRQNQMKGE